MPKATHNRGRRRFFRLKFGVVACARYGKKTLFQSITAANIAVLWATARLFRPRRAVLTNAAQGFGLCAGDVVLVLVPHPDDETLGMGATLAALADAGVNVHLLLITDGSLSGAGILGPQAAPARADIRMREFRTAIKILSPKISYSGPVCREQPGLAPEEKAKAGQIARQLLEGLSPKIVFAPPPFDYHPHHVFAADLAAALTDALIYYEVQSPFARRDHWVGIANTPAEAARHQQAMRAYISQAQTAKNAARLHLYRRVETGTSSNLEAFLPAKNAAERPAHRRGLSHNPRFDLGLMRGPS